MRDILIYLSATFFEIFGCFAFWMVLRLNKPWPWLFPGIVSLIFFGWLLTLVRADFAGRAYAIYGGIYIIASLVWLYFAEHEMPDRWDMAGAALCIAGVGVILFMPR